MCKALLKLFEPEIEQLKAEAERRAEEETRNKLKEGLGLTDEQLDWIIKERKKNPALKLTLE